MVSTLPGMEMLVTSVEVNAFAGMTLSAVPMVTVLRLEQSLKVLLPISSVLLGMATALRAEQYLKAS